MQDRASTTLRDHETSDAQPSRAPRIYAWTPPLDMGPSERDRELRRIAAMGFDALLVEPDGGAPLADMAKAAAAARLRVVIRTARGDIERAPGWLRDGARGCLFTTATSLGPDAWRKIFAELRAVRPDATFIAEAFGRSHSDIAGLANAGFDFVLDNFAWWDLREDWYLDEHNALRGHARTIATLEPSPGHRLRDSLAKFDSTATSPIYVGRYALAAIAADGLLVTHGYEFGEGADPVAAKFDVSGDIGRINRWKSDHAALAGGTPLRRASAPDAAVLALARGNASADCAVVLYNRSTAPAPSTAAGNVAVVAGGGVIADAFTGEHLNLSSLTLARFETRLLTVRSARAMAEPNTAETAAIERDHLARSRIAIEAVSPQIDGGRFPVKRVLGDTLRVEADIFMDGHEVLAARLKHRFAGAADWRETPTAFFDNDRWAAEIPLDRIGRLEFTVEAWRDLWATWRDGTVKKHDAGHPIALELREGTILLDRHVAAAKGEARGRLEALAKQAASTSDPVALGNLLASDETARVVAEANLRDSRTVHAPVLDVVVDRPRAAFAAWYEVFPRSMSDDETRHGTFDDVIAKLPYVKGLGFDVLYFPPIHPIGRVNRKGRNNTLSPARDDPGSPYAIGSVQGGHDAIHPELGSFEDFARLIAAATEQDIEIAIDFAIQCAPDHPWIADHPEWFDWRPDGTIKFAENPPKKYEDIVNVHFYRDAYPSIWMALRDVVLFWIAHGVTMFRVDNPHTKPLPFWEWMIADVQARHPETVFLSEAFTRPKMMKRLAKAGFTQSYSYFTWRNTKQELIDYLTELTQTEAREYMRPNFFVNTPDINPLPLQTAGRAGFRTRLVLAATLSPLYGVYSGFELCEASPVPGKEEYLDSEKYQLKAWDWDREGHIREDVALINRIRRDNPAFWRFDNLLFLNAWNDNILVYAKMTTHRDNLVLVAVNLDPHNAHSAHFEAPLWEFGLPDEASVDCVDLVHGGKSVWQGKVQQVHLDPAVIPYAIWRLSPQGMP